MNKNKIYSDEDNVLECPRCGYDYLHQGDVIPYENGNKYGIQIVFECEGCDHCPTCGNPYEDLKLNIYQQKGRTFIEWNKYYKPIK